jgi:Zn-dependent protease with chaperone function
MKQIVLQDISPRNWEHPADRAALSALKKMKGFDELVKKVIGFTTEKSLRLIHLASSVKVTNTQFARINHALNKACAVFDCPTKPDVFIAQSPFLNAATLGADNPFIVIQSNTVLHLSDEELLCVVGHELGHILSGHVLYKTLLWLLVNVSFRLIKIPFSNLVLIPIILALKEWDRKSELTADRVGLLASQNENPNYTLLMKLSGGPSIGDMNVNDFFLQAEQYQNNTDTLDNVYKLLNVLMNTHPFGVVRLQELKTWAASGQYKKILDGNYARKGAEEEDSTIHDFHEARDYYKEKVSDGKSKFDDVIDTLGDGADKVFDKIGEVFKDLFG